MNPDEDEEFHDSEWDIFDLFNATNGDLRQDGLLEISRLDEYSPEEKEELNVPRLREIWEHTATGCRECRRIVKMLGEIRGALRPEDEEESFDGQTEGSNRNVSNSRS